MVVAPMGNVERLGWCPPSSASRPRLSSSALLAFSPSASYPRLGRAHSSSVARAAPQDILNFARSRLDDDVMSCIAHVKKR